MGRLARKAMSSVPIVVAKMVAVSRESKGNPCAASGANMMGISAKMYDMVVKVVRPESTSVFKLCCCRENPTNENNLAFMMFNFTLCVNHRNDEVELRTSCMISVKSQRTFQAIGYHAGNGQTKTNAL